MEENIKMLGQMEGYEVINRVYSDEGICPTINTCGGGGHQPKILEINTVTVPQTVRVRKYQVDIEKLKECLRSHKNKTNKEIAEHLDIPITKVEHWFRADSSFSIPDEEHWHKLKDLLEIETEEFDTSIMTFEEREGVYDKGERLYIPNGIAPTLTVAGGERIIETQIVAMRGRDPQNPSDRTPGNPNLVQRLEPNSEGISNTITTVQKDNMVLELGHIEKGTGKHQSNVVYSENGCAPTICASYGVKQPPAMHVEVRQATKEGSIPCEIGGGGRSELPNKPNTQRTSSREWTDKSDTNNGEYP